MPYKDPERQRLYQIEYGAKLRKLAVARLGGPRCVNCGCDDERLLEINHIRGGGRRESHNLRGYDFIHAIATGKRRVDDLEVRCKPCNVLHYVTLRFGVAVANRFRVSWS